MAFRSHLPKTRTLIFTRQWKDRIQPKKNKTLLFVENLLKTLFTKFYKNRPSFIEDMTKTFWLLFIRTRYWHSHKTRRLSFTRWGGWWGAKYLWHFMQNSEYYVAYHILSESAKFSKTDDRNILASFFLWNGVC